jgi:hypothetical protein
VTFLRNFRDAPVWKPAGTAAANHEIKPVLATMAHTLGITNNGPLHLRVGVDPTEWEEGWNQLQHALDTLHAPVIGPEVFHHACSILPGGSRATTRGPLSNEAQLEARLFSDYELIVACLSRSISQLE